MPETPDTNPLLQISFAIPFDRIRAEHVRPAVARLLDAARRGVDAVAEDPSPPTYENTLRALEDVVEPLGWAMGVVGHLESVATTPELREAYNAVQPEVTAFFSGIPLNAGLWARLKAFAGTDQARALTGVRARHLKKTLDEFRRAGADLDEAGKRRLSELDVELDTLTTRFSQNLLDATAGWELYVEDAGRLSGLPDGAVEAARQGAQARGREGWRFTLQAPSYVPVVSYADDAGLRETLWRAHNTRATEGERDNRPLIDRILRLRREKAGLLGYRDFADLVLEDRMAGDGARAQAFVDDLRTRTEPYYAAENATLLAFRRELEGPDAPALAPWDVTYYAERQRRALYDFDAEQLRPYFPAEQVLDGLFETVRRVYGVRIEPRRDLPVWDEAVRTYDLFDGSRLLGAFYVDPHPRENKRDGAWMNQLRVGEREAGRRDPHLGLICANLQPPLADRPALLTHDEVETLFHEFGHLTHLLFSEVEVRSLAGTHVAWDFVELPSQIMENWVWEKQALDLFARHYGTGEAIPDALFQRMQRARTYRAANQTMRQLGFAAVDLALHRDYDPERDGDVMAYARRILQAHTPASLPDDYGMLAGFGHLFGHSVGYAAGYYSYKWAEALDADAFTRFREAGVFDAEVGRAFRTQVLARGDAEEPMDLYKAFMGREPRLEPLLERSGLAAGSHGELEPGL